MGITVRLLDATFSVVVFAISFLICYQHGFELMHPLDQSIVFDGAWRLYGGQWFFDDFRTPVGFVPIVFQFGFFSAFGVNWWSYCLHAALLNGLFAVAVFRLLRLFGGGNGLSALMGLLSAVTFYAPMATPYPDQHALLFMMLAVVVAARAFFATGRTAKWLWMLVPVTITCGLLSKQMPAALIIPTIFVLFLLSILRSNQRKSNLLGAGIGTLLALGLVLLLFRPSVILSEAFSQTWFQLPAQLGAERISENNLQGFGWWRGFYLRPFQILSKQNTTLSVIQLLPIVFIPILLSVRKFREKMGGEWSYHVAILSVILGLHLSSSFFADVTSNQRENGIPFIPVCIGLVLVWLSREDVKGFFLQQIPRSELILKAVTAFVLLVICWDVYQFDQRVNQTRLVLESEFIKDGSTVEMVGGSGLEGMHFAAAYYPKEMRPDSLILFLKEQPGEFFLFGDMSLLYGLTGRRSVSPVLWFHEGLTLPKRDSPEFGAFSKELTEAVIGSRPRYVIFDGTGRLTYTHLPWEAFPELNAWLQSNTLSTRKMFGFEVCELKRTL